MKQLIEKYRNRLKCLVGRHEFLVRDCMMSALTDLRCTRPDCKFVQVIKVDAEQHIPTAVNLRFVEGRGILYEIYRTDINRKILAIAYQRGDAVMQGQQFINLAAKLVRQAEPKKPAEKVVNIQSAEGAGQ